MKGHRRMSRRVFLQGSALILGGLMSGSVRAADSSAQSLLQFGLLTDVHYADKETRGTRHYRDSLSKVMEAVDRFNQYDLGFVVHLGDLIDRADSIEAEQANLAAVESVLEGLQCSRHYVLGNHCVDGLTKEEFMAGTAMEALHLAFEQKGVRFVTLDACYRSDGVDYGRHNFDWKDPNISEEQLRWLEAELSASDAPTIVFAHQRLDEAPPYHVRNAPEVRAILEASGNVLAVFQGHSHQQTLQEINGIPYCTQVATVEGPAPESSAYGIASVYGDGSIRLEGYRRQEAVSLCRTPETEKTA